MIYFLVNNNYHLILDLHLAKQLSGHKLGLIQIPFLLDTLSENALFDKIICLEENEYGSIRNTFFHRRNIKKLKKHIDNILKIEDTDILFVHTEIILLNQYIIQKFYNSNAKIFLLEDGTATMSDNNCEIQRTRMKEKIKTIFLRNIVGLKYTSIVSLGAQVLPRMEDYIFNGIIVNFGNRIKRNIPLYKLRQEQENLKIEYENGCIFFSQALYFWYLSEDEYIKFIEYFLFESSHKFTPFYFKFHPSEKESVKNRISLIIKDRFPNIKIIKEDLVAERLIYTYPVHYAITITSTAALNLINKNVIPIFMINIFNELYPTKDGIVFSNFLKSINCNSPKLISEVEPNFTAFSCKINEDSEYTLIEILNLNNND